MILPPGINIVLALIGFFLVKRYRKTGWFFIIFAIVSLYFLSISLVSRQLAGTQEKIDPLPPIISADTDRQAIVLLGGGAFVTMPEYGKPVPYPNVLERIRYAMHIQRQTNLPILVSGGSVFPASHSEAWIINQVMIDDFNFEAKWLEETSHNTAENAGNSFKILQAEGIDRIFLVTHSIHMNRAVEIFESQGFDVIPAPTIFLSEDDEPFFMLLLPKTISLSLSRDILHEMFGQWWYKIRHN